MYGVSTDENGLYYMRTRYYNVGIKRFINADTEKGSIDVSQSLNRYCYVQGNPVSYTDPFGLSPAFNLQSFAHGVLDFLGCFPYIGIAANIANAAMYAEEGDTFNMSLCIVSAVAGGVASAVKIAVKCGKIAKPAIALARGMKMLENAAVFTVSAGHAAETAKGMWQKYAEDKRPVGLDTLGEVASLGLSVFAAGSSAKQFGVNGNKLRSMKVKEKIGSNVGKTAGSQDIDNRVVENAFFSNGERIATTKQIRKYKKQMKRIGINVVVDKKGIVLNEKKVAGFDYSSGTIYIKKKSGVIDLYHEGYHAEQYLNIGQQNYIELGQLEREEYVYSQIMKNSHLFNNAELQGANEYISRLRRKG